MEDSNPVIIETNEDYEVLCNYIESKKPIVVEIGDDYFITEDDHFQVSKDYKWVIEDITNYVVNGIDDVSKDNSDGKKYIIVKSKQDIKECIDHIKTHDFLAYDIETDGLITVLNQIIGFSICGKKGEAFYIPHKTWDTSLQALVEVISYGDCLSILKEIKKKQILTWNGSFDTRFTNSFFGIDLTDNIYADGMLMKHLLEEEGDFGLKPCAIQFQKEIGLDVESAANQEQIEIKENVLKNGGVLTKAKYELYKADLEVMGKYACADADLTFRLCEYFNGRIIDEGLETFFYDEEVMPTYKEATIEMEKYPVLLDMELIRKTKSDISKERASLKKKILDIIYSSPEFQKYLKDMLDEKVPVSNKGKFAVQTLIHFSIELTLGSKGKPSITKAIVEKMKESVVKEFLLGRASLEDSDIFEIKKKVWESENEDYINISSTDQLGKFTFNYLKFKPLSKTAGGKPQFDDDTIQYLADEEDVEWAKLLGDYNKLGKIESTYVDRFLENNIDGVYYFYYKQHGTISGRFSSDAQQLPRPKEKGELSDLVLKYNNIIREFFIAGEGRSFIDNDYESLEPHIFAHVSGDEGLKDIFRNNYDFYSTIAIATEKIEGVSADKSAPNYLGKLNKPARQKSKEYSLGIPYGKTPYALAMSLGVSKELAQELYDGYLDSYPSLKMWMVDTNKFVQKNGYITTQTGRVRHLPKVKELHKEHGEKLLDYKYRNSLQSKLKAKIGSEDAKKKVTSMYLDYKNGLNNGRNFQIQGLAASVVNRAMVAITRAFKASKIDGWVCATIHDQIICNVANKDVDKAKKIVQDCMVGTVKLSIDLKAPPAVGNNWRDAH